MEYDPAFPTEDNDDDVDHIIDVTEIPLPVSKKKNKRQAKLMKIPLPEEKSSESSKSVVETSNSPPQEPDTSWLLPTSTQGPLKFNIIKPNAIKPTDEENSIFDDLDMKMEPSKPVKLLPKKSKPMTLPTGVIVKNADFVVNEPKTNTELFLPPKITTTENNINSTNESANNNLSSINNQNLINSYPMMNMSYIIPQKLRSAQMISQPLVANPAVASLNQKKAQEITKNEPRKRSRSSSRERKSSKSPKVCADSIIEQSLNETDSQNKQEKNSETKTTEENEKSPKLINNESLASELKNDKKQETSNKNIDMSYDVRSCQKKSNSKSRSRSFSRDKNNLPENKNNKHRRSGSRKSRSGRLERQPNVASHRQNSPRNIQKSNKTSKSKMYQRSKSRSQSHGKRRKSTSRNRNRSPYQNRHRKSDSRSRRSQSPHRGLGNRSRVSPDRNKHRSPRSRSRNRRSVSPDTRQVGNSSNNYPRSRSRKRSGSKQKNHNQQSNSQKRDSWTCDSSEKIVNNRKKSTDCWAVESESGDELTTVNSEICDKDNLKSTDMNLNLEIEKLNELSDEKIIVSSSNTAQNSLKMDKNEDTTVSSTVDETKPGYCLGNINDTELVEVDSNENEEMIKKPDLELQVEEKNNKAITKICKSRSVSQNNPTARRKSCSSEFDKNSKWERSRKIRVSSRSPLLKHFKRNSPPNRRRSRSRSARSKDQEFKNRNPRQSRNSRTPNRYPRALRNPNEDYNYKRNYSDFKPCRDRFSRSTSSNFKYSRNKPNVKKRYSSSGSEHVLNSSKTRRHDKQYNLAKKRNRSFSSVSENENKKYVKTKETGKSKKESRTSDESWEVKNKNDMQKSRKFEENKYLEKAHRRNDSQESNEMKQSKIPRSRKRSDSNDSHFKRSKKNNRRQEEFEGRNLKKKKINCDLDDIDQLNDVKKVKSKPKRNNSLSKSISSSRSLSVESQNFKRSKKSNKDKKMKKHKKSRSSSLNSEKIPASYQGVKKSKRKERVTSGSESSLSIKKCKSKKVRKL